MRAGGSGTGPRRIASGDPTPSAAEDEALDALCSTVPTTIAGARAAIEHVMAVEDDAEGGFQFAIRSVMGPQRHNARFVHFRFSGGVCDQPAGVFRSADPPTRTNARAAPSALV